MKFYEKYAKLRQKSYVTQMISKSVSGTMALENQAVADDIIHAIVIAMIRESELKGREFWQN
jgi:hypothetical protein